MIPDVKTVIWKEIREILGRTAGFKGGRAGLLVFIFVFGILLPLQNGRGWIESPLVMLYWAWIPFLLVSGVVADAFAGERERHTLETLLASRLSDKAILFGKIGAAVTYGWGLTLVSVVLGAVAVSIAHGGGRVLFYAPPIAAGILVSTFLVAMFGAGLGVMISLRASTVRQAQQTFSLAFLLIFVPLMAIPILPDSIKARLFAWLSKADASSIAPVALGLLVAADAALIALAMARFRRARLILD